MAGLFDYEFQLDKIKKHQPPLQKLNKIIDWELFRQPIEEALIKDDRKSNAGRKPYDKLLMFKIIILQRYYNLSAIVFNVSSFLKTSRTTFVLNSALYIVLFRLIFIPFIFII